MVSESLPLYFLAVGLVKLILAFKNIFGAKSPWRYFRLSVAGFEALNVLGMLCEVGETRNGEVTKWVKVGVLE